MKTVMCTFDNFQLPADLLCGKCSVKLNKVDIYLTSYQTDSLSDLDLWSSAKLIQYQQNIQFLCTDCHTKSSKANQGKDALQKKVDDLILNKSQLEKEIQTAKTQLKEQEELIAFANSLNQSQIVEHLTVFKNLAERFEEVWNQETQISQEAQELITMLKSPFEGAENLYKQPSKEIFISCLDEFDLFVEQGIERRIERIKKLEEMQTKIKESFQSDIECGILNEILIKKVIEGHREDSGTDDMKELLQISKLIREQIEKSFQ